MGPRGMRRSLVGYGVWNEVIYIFMRCFKVQFHKYLLITKER